MTRRNMIHAAFGASAAFAAPLWPRPGAPPPMKITGVDFLRLRYPGKVPVKRNGTITSGGGAPGMTQLELKTDAGIVGRSLAVYGGPISYAGVHEIITDYLAPRIMGMNPFQVEAIWDRMYRYNRKPVAKGSYISAMGAVDIAIWDIIGKALEHAGLPSARRLLG